MEMEEEEEKKKDGSAEVGRWNKFLPRMLLRVLLVEADDSTRQIIAALLRKCGYKVAAVRDGLKAWEALKGRPHNIDLILTEVELPSISGFALLTLVMEHDICKNIPVVMMSSHDSISMVFKCMLKGASDFLIKPVRRNELKNLWQHVWRRRTPTGGHVSQHLAVRPHKVEATSENIAASNYSSGYAVSTQKNKECSEKGSDAQISKLTRKEILCGNYALYGIFYAIYSSCTTPNLEAESAYIQNMQGLLQPKSRNASNLSDTDKGKHEGCVKLDKESVMPESETGGKSLRLGSEISLCNEAYNSPAFRMEEDHACAKTMSWDEGVEPASHREKANITSESHGCNDELIEPSAEAIDLIGTFDNQSKCTYGHSSFNDGANKFGFAPPLELSLRRCHSSSSKNQGIDEGHTLNHSSASAFSWYNSGKTLQPLFPTLVSNSTEAKEGINNSHKQLSNQILEKTVDTSQLPGAALSNSQENMTTLVIGQSGQVEAAFPSAPLGLIPVPAVRLDSLCAGYRHVFPPLYYTKSGLPRVWSPKSTSQQEQSPVPMSSSHQSNPEIHESQQSYCPFGVTTDNSTDQTVHEQENNLECCEDLRHGSPATSQSGRSSLCNDVVNHLNSSAHTSICNRSDGNATSPAPVVRVTAAESVNGEGHFIQDGFKGIDSNRSIQREAALMKFRLKRKDRCYEKKVRYQSRKRLAEQRPRVKGQFVRQVQTDPPTTDAVGCQ
ncbi:hypothetical protein L1049_014264 [Liquidambar formosana]|uniref:Two-component response regulator-like APRR5 n=1 Tax=Liquidambar formosana TaxID=63359 RepID=A0AAP0WXI9_LIQFO